ncbi:hypothetical protein K435DRAFT_926941 [Dendrothele bispora CBS 962.96]|uniref:Uncharacterized protein n=1 Tax=Dendrothele bispora (strain CBS 962.96) TaxID=1314807 RepID=A0A4S8L8M5_DENBC|nr:hypothetical protein K435DRAFT_926941 [Dendrothele bispora CBS 962.96]
MIATHTYLDGTGPFMSWVCGPWRPFIARRPCPYRGYLRFVCAYAHALSQYFPVPHRPLWLGGLFFISKSTVVHRNLCILVS